MIKLSEIVFDTNKKQDFRYTFDVLVAIGYQNKGSTLYYISPYGLIREVTEYEAIGSGRPYAAAFLKKNLE
jgi:20S proteasome alpha/beta subunit